MKEEKRGLKSPQKNRLKALETIYALGIYNKSWLGSWLSYLSFLFFDYFVHRELRILSLIPIVRVATHDCVYLLGNNKSKHYPAADLRQRAWAGPARLCPLEFDT